MKLIAVIRPLRLIQRVSSKEKFMDAILLIITIGTSLLFVGDLLAMEIHSRKAPRKRML